MNIFILDPIPELAAIYHCDQHTSKMILESAQMLSVALPLWYPETAPRLSKPTHIHHPCTRWVCESQANALWLTRLMNELDMQRFSAFSHESMPVARLAYDYLCDTVEEQTPFVFVGPAEIVGKDVCDQYRNYYRWKHHQWSQTKNPGPMRYKYRTPPTWLL